MCWGICNVKNLRSGKTLKGILFVNSALFIDYVCLQELDTGRFGISLCVYHIFCHLRDDIFLNSFDIYEKVASLEVRSQVLVNHSGSSYGSHCTKRP